MSRFIVLGPNRENCATTEAVFADVAADKIPNADYLAALYPKKGLSLKLFRLCKKSVWRRLHFPSRFSYAWELNWKDIKPLIHPGEDTIFIFCMITKPFQKIRPELLPKLRRKVPGCRIVYYMIDSLERISNSNKVTTDAMLDYFKAFDMLFTFDRLDAERFSLPFADIPVIRVPDDPNPAPECDLFFCGWNKGRHQLLTQIAEHTPKARFLVSRVADEKRVENPVFEYITRVPYTEMIRQQRGANCILEILAEGNSGATLRYKEAVMYNQKLISNNPHLKELPYYDPRWMRYFETSDDIDYEWVARRENVDYGYTGDFSVQTLLETIEQTLDK